MKTIGPFLVGVVALVGSSCGGSTDATSLDEPTTEVPAPGTGAPEPTGEGPGEDKTPTDGNSNRGEEFCFNGELDRQETSVDCGGVCPPCTDVGDACDDDTDCGEGLLCGFNDGLCDLESCENEMLDDEETDIDCGGSFCATRCSEGEACLEVDSNGTRSVPAAENCRDETGAKTECDPELGICNPPTCEDGLINQGESDEDCGGPCLAFDQRCIDGQACFDDGDCELDQVVYHSPVGDFTVFGNAANTAAPNAACEPLFEGSPCLRSTTITYTEINWFCSDSGQCTFTETEGAKECVRLTDGNICIPDAPPAPREVGEGCVHSPDDCSVNPYRLEYSPTEFECLEGACVPLFPDESIMIDLADSVECVDGPLRDSSVTVVSIETECINRTSNQCSVDGTRMRNERHCTRGDPTPTTVNVPLSCSLADPPIGDSCGSSCRLVHTGKSECLSGCKCKGTSCRRIRHTYDRQTKTHTCGSNSKCNVPSSWTTVGQTTITNSTRGGSSAKGSTRSCN
ncbi:MAG: hypothetical protein AAFU77_10555 [Myxococcota bacterium]